MAKATIRGLHVRLSTLIESSRFRLIVRLGDGMRMYGVVRLVVRAAILSLEPLELVESLLGWRVVKS